MNIDAAAGDASGGGHAAEGDETPEKTETDNVNVVTAVSILKQGNSRAKSAIARVDFSGVWKRTNTVNFDAFVGAQGAGYVQRKLAASMALTHTITMDPPFYSGVRIMKKGGPLDIDNSYAFGAEPKLTKIVKRTFYDTCYWEGEALVLRRLHEDKSFELILKRYLEDDGNAIRLVSVHHNIKTGEQVESISFFSKAGPSPVPVTEVFVGGAGAGTGDGGGAAAAAAAGSSPEPAFKKAVSFGPNELIMDE